MNVAFSFHAKEQMLIRGISERMVMEVIAEADREIMQDDEVRIYQKVISFNEEGNFLVRVFVTISKMPPQIITVYRTSKLEKYQ